jgi:serine/threonine-protein kinase RsbW
MSNFSREPPRAAPSAEARFSRTGIAADAQSATRTRAQFGEWLATHLPFEEGERDDVLLATYEALANAAEYAYWDTPRQGTMSLLAHYLPGPDRLVVTVSDGGRWRPPADVSAEHPVSLRGRGIPLMHALADDATIRGTAGGTHVRLSWGTRTAR